MAKRGRKPKKEGTFYFCDREEKAIVTYLTSDDEEEKELVYNEIIHPAFVKMVSSIIRTYKLFVPEEEYDVTFNDTLSFLITKLKCFDPSKGKKAYSYYGTICKNYLLYRNSKYANLKKKFEKYEEINENINKDFIYSPEESTFKDTASVLINEISVKIMDIISKSEEYSLNENEIKVGYALCDLLDNWEDIIEDTGSNKLNKSSILYYLREETMMTTKELRDNMKKYKAAYLILKKHALEN